MKVLLPVWAVVLLAVAAATAGAAAVDAGAPWWVGALVAVALCPGAVFVLRRVLPRFGAEAYEELPESYFGWRRVKHEMLSDLLNRFLPIVAGIAAGLPALALGIGTEAAVWDLPVWLVCGFATGWPVYAEVDARLALRFARENAEEEGALHERVAAARAEVGTSETTVPVDRRFGFGLAVFCVGAGLGCGAMAALATDMGVVARVIVGAGAPFFLFAGARWVSMTTAPFAVRTTAAGIEVLGRPAIPWSDVVAVDLETVNGMRHLSIWLTDPPDGAPVRDRGLGWLTKVRKGAVAFPVRLCAWPPERVLAAVQAHGVEDVGVALA